MNATDQMPTLRLVPLDEVVQRWSEFRKVLDRALQHARGELGVDDILAGVGNAKMAILALEQGEQLQLLAAFEVTKYPQRSVLNLIAVAGRNLAGLAVRFDLVDAIAKQMGASTIRCYCRPSVARHIKRLFPETQEAYIVMEREVA